MRPVRFVPAMLIVVACAPAPAGTGGGSKASGGSASPELLATVDSIIETPIREGKLIGGSVAVVRGSDTLVRKQYGYADAELETPTPLRAVYEIGSVTKQFTGAAIMQLVEQGKVDLNADVRTYLPDLPTKGRKVTVRQLLDHTSGIKGYTEMPKARPLFHRAVPKDSIVAMFMAEPWDFEPGEEQIYNNSAFFLAGLIIEKVSGKTYEQYVQENLFDRAGMKNSHYCSERAIQPGKVKGYDSDSAGPILRAPISHAWPYAAGSLCSTVSDLVAWNAALHRDGRILGPAAYAEFIRPGKLNDGTTLGYGMGIAVYDRLGRRALHHGGGINGFLSENLYFPDDSLSVVVLFNTAGPVGPDAAAMAIAKAVLGEPKDDARPFEGDLARLAGVYAGKGRGRPTELTFEAADNVLTVKGSFIGDTARALKYIGNNTFRRDETRFIFGESGGRARVRVDAGYGNNLLVRK